MFKIHYKINNEFIMTYLCINNINNISLSNILINDYNTIYKIQYKLNDIIINGLLFKCYGNLVEDNDKYKIIISDNKKLKLIDEFFLKNLDNYNKFLIKDNRNNTYIEIKKNNIVNNILNKYKNNNIFYLNIKFINKYNNTPIIYLI